MEPQTLDNMNKDQTSAALSIAAKFNPSLAVVGGEADVRRRLLFTASNDPAGPSPSLCFNQARLGLRMVAAG